MFGSSAACISETGQCEFERKDDFTWTVRPVASAANATFVNGTVLAAETVLDNGMDLAVGNAISGNKGISVKVDLIT